MNTAVVGVGSNIDPERHIALARSILAEEHRLVTESRYETTKPVGYADQPDFVNGALLVATVLDREAFVAYLHGVEDRLGRVRTANRNGPRTIDLDVVVWNGTVVDPDVHTRAFLRDAVSQVAPNALSR